MLDNLKEFRETLVERIKSPFIGSFMIAWSILHWRVFLLLFYNESGIQIKQRILDLEVYIKTESTWSLIIWPILLTLIILIGYGTLNSIGLFIKLLYDNWAAPYIQKFVYNKNIIEKSKYEQLKSQYTILQKEYDEEKETYISTEKEFRDIKISFDSYQTSSFAGQETADTTSIFNKISQWENSFTYPDGKIGRELFNVEYDGFYLNNGTKIGIKNIKSTKDGRFVTFTKVIGENILINNLVMNESGDYCGFENNSILVSYKKIRLLNYSVEQATYGSGSLFFNITRQVSNLINSNKVIVASNEYWGDPTPGTPKKLEIIMKLGNTENKVLLNEGESWKAE